MLQLFKKLSACFSINAIPLDQTALRPATLHARVVHLKLMKQCYGGNQISTKHADKE